LGGAAGNAASQGINNLDKTQKGFSFKQLGISTLVGGALGYAGAKVGAFLSSSGESSSAIVNPVANMVDEANANLPQSPNQTVPAGNGAANAPVRGTLIHSEFKNLVQQTYDQAAQTEVSCLGGQVVPRATAGSIR